MSQTAFALDRQGNITATPAVTTVVFTAHNRRDMVLDAIRLALGQTVPVHVIVADDASSDGTQAAVAKAFPGVTYLRSEVSRGPCYARNKGTAMALTDIVFPLDDDSMLVSPRTLEQALQAFDDPQLGIVAIPFRNVLQGDYLFHDPAKAPRNGQFFDFIACAHGIRRCASDAVGGWYEPYFYMCEETDIAVRFFEQGWRSAIVNADPIHHMQPPARRAYRPDFYGRRNDVLFTWVRLPWRILPLAMVRCLARGIKSGIINNYYRATFDGYFDALRAIISGKVRRDPISHETAKALFAERRELSEK